MDEKRIVGRPFEPGQSGNPSGRPKGSRNKLAEDFLADLREAWQERGKASIAELTGDQLVNAVVKTLPKEMTLEVGETYADLLRRAHDVLAAKG